jgi:hypothetical protein
MATSKEFSEINALLYKLKAETESCINQVARLEKDLKQSNLLNKTTVPVRHKQISRLLKVIGYEQGDSMKTSIAKMEAYILENDLINYDTLLVIPDAIIAEAFQIREGNDIRYESLLAQIPNLFK